MCLRRMCTYPAVPKATRLTLTLIAQLLTARSRKYRDRLSQPAWETVHPWQRMEDICFLQTELRSIRTTRQVTAPSNRSAQLAQASLTSRTAVVRWHCSSTTLAQLCTIWISTATAPTTLTNFLILKFRQAN